MDKKEQLEEIDLLVDDLYNNKLELREFINYHYEQVQELKKEVSGLYWRNEWLKSQEQNGRYREAIEKLVNAPKDMPRGRYADYADMVAREAWEDPQ